MSEENATQETTADQPTAPTIMFTVKEAAAYLDVSESCIRYHVYTTGFLSPDNTTYHRLKFTRETLDAFRSSHMNEIGYTAKEAAAYLGVSHDTIRTHVFYFKSLRPDSRRHNAHVFSLATLEAWRATYLKETEPKAPTAGEITPPKTRRLSRRDRTVLSTASEPLPALP